MPTNFSVSASFGVICGCLFGIRTIWTQEMRPKWVKHECHGERSMDFCRSYTLQDGTDGKRGLGGIFSSTYGWIPTLAGGDRVKCIAWYYVLQSSSILAFGAGTGGNGLRLTLPMGQGSLERRRATCLSIGMTTLRLVTCEIRCQIGLSPVLTTRLRQCANGQHLP